AVNGVSHVQISHGTVQNFANDDICLQNADHVEITGVTVKGSTIGVLLSGSSNNHLEQDTIDGNSAYGVAIFPGSNGNHIEGNEASGNQIAIAVGARSNHVENNRANANGIGILGGAEAVGNHFEENVTNFNSIAGITMEAGATGNHIEGNSALHNVNVD